MPLLTCHAWQLFSAQAGYLRSDAWRGPDLSAIAETGHNEILTCDEDFSLRSE